MDSPELHPAGHGANVDRTDGPGRQSARRLISAAEFQQLADVPAAAEWLANVDNPNTRRAYRNDVGEFMSMLGIRHFDEFPTDVRRAHVIAWRKMLEERDLGAGDPAAGSSRPSPRSSATSVTRTPSA